MKETILYDIVVGERNNTNTTVQRRTQSQSYFLFGSDTGPVNNIGVPDSTAFIFYRLEYVNGAIHLLSYNQNTQTFETVVFVTDPALRQDTTTLLTVSLRKACQSRRVPYGQKSYPSFCSQWHSTAIEVPNAHERSRASIV